MIIRAPSRIHMSLIDLNGSYRRVDGGIGLALADPQFVLEVEKTENGITLEFADTVDDEEAILECQEKYLTQPEKLLNILTLIQVSNSLYIRLILHIPDLEVELK